MTFFELFLIGIGLSMDAFAVSICKGLSMQKIDKKYTLCIALFFGGFQALMPAARLCTRQPLFRLYRAL